MSGKVTAQWWVHLPMMVCQSTVYRSLTYTCRAEHCNQRSLEGHVSNPLSATVLPLRPSHQRTIDLFGHDGGSDPDPNCDVLAASYSTKAVLHGQSCS